MENLFELIKKTDYGTVELRLTVNNGNVTTIKNVTSQSLSFNADMSKKDKESRLTNKESRLTDKD